MPDSREIDLSCFMAAYRCPVPDLGALSREWRAICSFAGAEASSGSADPGISLAQATLGRVRLALVEAERGVVAADFDDDKSLLVGFVLAGAARVSPSATAPTLDCRAGEGLVIEQRRSATTTIGAGTRLLMIALPIAAMRAAGAQTARSRRNHLVVAPTLISATSRAGTILKHATVHCANEVTAPGSALREPAFAKRFERFVLKTLLVDLGIGEPPSGLSRDCPWPDDMPRFDAA